MLRIKSKLIFFSLIILQVCVYAKEIDYRQVVFGNAYKNIVEVDVNDFFTKFPKAKNVESYGQGPIAYTINRNSSYCLAEVNFYTTEKGWIFGNIDE